MSSLYVLEHSIDTYIITPSQTWFVHSSAPNVVWGGRAVLLKVLPSFHMQFEAIV